MSNYFYQLWIAADQAANALLGGWADETISSRSYRQRHKPRWAIAYKLINALFFWQNDHCRGAYNQEKIRSHTAPEFRSTE
jgi:hypothetical protein